MESSLSAQFRDLQAEIGFMLGYGRGADFSSTAWTTDQQAAIDRCTKAGLRDVYFCGYEWSFLRPMASLTLDEGASTVQLPDDFGGAEGRLIVTSTTSILWYPLDFVGEGQIYQAFAQQPDRTGRPMMACVEPLKGTQATAGQRFQLHVFPTADASYTLQFTYYILPNYLDGSQPYLYGGAEHSETFLSACLAASERLLDDTAGPYAAAFAQKLEVSKMLDRRKKPQKLGYNGDRSDAREVWDQSQRPTQHGLASVTYNGVQY